MNKKLETAKYVISDMLSAVIAWTFFFIYRKFIVYPDILLHKEQIYNDLICIKAYCYHISMDNALYLQRNLPQDIPQIQTKRT